MPVGKCQTHWASKLAGGILVSDVATYADYNHLSDIEVAELLNWGLEKFC